MQQVQEVTDVVMHVRCFIVARITKYVGGVGVKSMVDGMTMFGVRGAVRGKAGYFAR